MPGQGKVKEGKVKEGRFKFKVGKRKKIVTLKGVPTPVGFCLEFRMESLGWRENPDQISATVRNGVSRLE